MRNLSLKSLLAVGVFCLPAGIAWGQIPPGQPPYFAALTVSSCGAQSLNAGIYAPTTMDLTGKFCDTGGGGGSTTAAQGAPNTAANAWPFYATVGGIAVSPSNALPTKSGIYVSAGTGQYGLTVATATSLTVPGGTLYAEICVETQSVRYKDDGGTPTSSSGLLAQPGCFPYAGPLASLSFIQTIASATLDVSYYK